MALKLKNITYTLKGASEFFKTMVISSIIVIALGIFSLQHKKITQLKQVELSYKDTVQMLTKKINTYERQLTENEILIRKVSQQIGYALESNAQMKSMLNACQKDNEKLRQTVKKLQKQLLATRQLINKAYQYTKSAAEQK